MAFYRNVLLIIFFGYDINDKILIFNLLASLLTLYISSHYFIEYSRNNNQRTFLLFLAFSALFFSGVSYVFARSITINYVLGHVLEFCSYALILTSLALTINKKRK